MPRCELRRSSGRADTMPRTVCVGRLHQNRCRMVFVCRLLTRYEQAHRLRSDVQFAASAAVAFTKLADIEEQTGNVEAALGAVDGALEYLHAIESRAAKAIDELERQHLQQKWERGKTIKLFQSAHRAAAKTAPTLVGGACQGEWWAPIIHRL